MTLQPADYAFTGLVIVLAVTGLFRGLSGTLAFMVASAAAALSGAAGWHLSARWLESGWSRAGATLVAVLLVFGIVRFAIKKTVNGLLAQPSDAVFGMLAGLAASVVILVVWAYSGVCVECSSLAGAAAGMIGGI